RKHPIHAVTEFVEGFRGRLEAVFEHKSGDSMLHERLGDFPALVAHRQPPESASGCHDDGRTVCLVRLRQERREGRGGYVASHRVAPLSKPALRRRLTFDATGTEWDGIRLRRGFERIDRSILSRSRCRQNHRRYGEDECKSLDNRSGPVHATWSGFGDG